MAHPSFFHKSLKKFCNWNQNKRLTFHSQDVHCNRNVHSKCFIYSLTFWIPKVFYVGKCLFIKLAPEDSYEFNVQHEYLFVKEVTLIRCTFQVNWIVHVSYKRQISCTLSNTHFLTNTNFPIFHKQTLAFHSTW